MPIENEHGTMRDVFVNNPVLSGILSQNTAVVAGLMIAQKRRKQDR